jgi:short-subunit dehydrogenase
MESHGLWQSENLADLERIIRERRENSDEVDSSLRCILGTSTRMSPKNMDSAESVVRKTLKAFDQKRAVAYPGRSSVRLASWLPRLLPRALVARIAGIATAKMGLDD